MAEKWVVMRCGCSVDQRPAACVYMMCGELHLPLISCPKDVTCMGVCLLNHSSESDSSKCQLCRIIDMSDSTNKPNYMLTTFRVGYQRPKLRLCPTSSGGRRRQWQQSKGGQQPLAVFFFLEDKQPRCAATIGKLIVVGLFFSNIKVNQRNPHLPLHGARNHSAQANPETNMIAQTCWHKWISYTLSIRKLLSF